MTQIAVVLGLCLTDGPFCRFYEESPAGAVSYNTNNPSPRTGEHEVNPVLVLQSYYKVYRKFDSEGMSPERWMQIDSSLFPPGRFQWHWEI